MKPNPEISGVARPFKIAFCIEDGEGVEHWLSAIFAECFGRDAGRQSLVVPVANGTIPMLYEDWLRVFDPDAVFLITNDNAGLLAKVEQLCSPLEMLDIQRKVEDRYVRLRLESQPLSSLSWLPMLRATAGPLRGKPEQILDCYPKWQDDGLISDNFGTLHGSFDRFPLHRELSGIVSPLMLTPANQDKQIQRQFGIQDGSEIEDAYAALKPLGQRGSTVSLAYLSNLSRQHQRVRDHPWINSFCLVIGDSFVDRVCCWNAGLLYGELTQAYRTLRLPASIIKSSERIEHIKHFLNASNWINRYGNQPQITVRSASVSEDELRSFTEQIKKGSWGTFDVERITTVEDCCPKAKEEERPAWMPVRRDDVTIREPLRHPSEWIRVAKPFQFQYLAGSAPIYSEGRWMFHVTIDRTSDNNRFGNVRDAWVLPRRTEIVQLFVEEANARIAEAGRLAIAVTAATDRVLVKEPSDETLFSYLLHQPEGYPYPDIRHSAKMAVPFAYSRPSDKGRYLQGVLGMFGSLHRAYEVLMNPFWRKQFARLGSPSEDQYPRIIKTLKKRFPPQGPQAGKFVFDSEEKWEKLARTFLSEAMNVRQPKYTVKLETLQRDWIEQLKAAIAVGDEHLKGHADAMIAEAPDDLTRSLERLCQEGAFHQGHSWSCRRCAYRNWTGLEGFKRTLECQVCLAPKDLPADLQFDFRMNDFLAMCLREHDTLSVIWALGRLGHDANSALIFAPQTELFRKYPEHQGGIADHELDLLCILNGRLVIGEVKASLSEIGDEEIDTLVNLAAELKPDLIIVAAMDGERNRLEARIEQLKKRVPPHTELRGLLHDRQQNRDNYHLS